LNTVSEPDKAPDNAPDQGSAALLWILDIMGQWRRLV
jgi:hypothetical protein